MQQTKKYQVDSCQQYPSYIIALQGIAKQLSDITLKVFHLSKMYILFSIFEADDMEVIPIQN